MKAVLPALVRSDLEPRLPSGVEACWYSEAADALAGIVDAEVAWLDMAQMAPNDLVRKAKALKWLFTMGAGVDSFDLGLLSRLGVTLTNGSGLPASPFRTDDFPATTAKYHFGFGPGRY